MKGRLHQTKERDIKPTQQPTGAPVPVPPPEAMLGSRKYPETLANKLERSNWVGVCHFFHLDTGTTGRCPASQVGSVGGDCSWVHKDPGNYPEPEVRPFPATLWEQHIHPSSSQSEPWYKTFNTILRTERRIQILPKTTEGCSSPSVQLLSDHTILSSRQPKGESSEKGCQETRRKKPRTPPLYQSKQSIWK